MSASSRCGSCVYLGKSTVYREISKLSRAKRETDFARTPRSLPWR